MIFRIVRLIDRRLKWAYACGSVNAVTSLLGVIMGAYVYFSIIDEKGDVSRITLHYGTVNDLVDFGLMVGDIANVAPLLNALVTGGLLNVGVCYEYDFSGLGWSSTPAAGSDVQEKGEFAFRTADGSISRINLPTFDEQFIATGTGNVDQADPAVAAFITYMLTGNGANPDPTDARASDLVSLAYAVENWGKRRR